MLVRDQGMAVVRPSLASSLLDSPRTARLYAQKRDVNESAAWAVQRAGLYDQLTPVVLNVYQVGFWEDSDEPIQIDICRSDRIGGSFHN
jgi:hypothetical protein